MVDVDLITPDSNQPRKEFNDEEIASTAFTVESQGIINPIEVDEKYMIVTGEIRWRAAMKAGLKQIPCIMWSDGTHKRFERQVVENLHHHQLSDQDRGDAIVKLWKTGQYPTMEALGKTVGVSRQQIGKILAANEFREKHKDRALGASTFEIHETSGLAEETQLKILEAFSQDKLKAIDVDKIRQVAKTSDALLEKVINQQMPLQRAVQAAETMQNIEKEGVSLTDDQKQNLANKVAEDETLLDKYKSAVLERVRQVATRPKTEPRITEPIGRTSPVQNIIKVKDEVMNYFKIYLGNCNVNERKWAKRIMIEIRDELNLLIEMVKED